LAYLNGPTDKPHHTGTTGISGKDFISATKMDRFWSVDETWTTSFPYTDVNGNNPIFSCSRSAIFKKYGIENAINFNLKQLIMLIV